MNDTLVGQSIQIGLDIIEQRCGYLGRFRRAQFLDHGAHATAMHPVAFAAYDILAHPLLGRFVLWHSTVFRRAYQPGVFY